MSIIFGSYIKNMREKHGLSQDFISKKINLSRPSYLEIEKGNKELTISEARNLANIFNLSLNDFLDQKEYKEPNINIIKKIEKDEKKIDDLRIDIPEENISKFKEILLYILEKVGAKQNIGETALYKILYFIDFDYYEKYEDQLMGLKYIKNIFGPTPVEFKVVIDEMEKNNEIEKVISKYFTHDQRKYLPKKSSNISKLSAQEIKHIDYELERLSNMNATELSNLSHKDTPWISAKDKEEISYESVFYRTKETSVREYNA